MSGWLSVVEHPAREVRAELQDVLAEIADPADEEARSISVVGTLTGMSRMHKCCNVSKITKEPEPP
jgi:hypothetical protein